MSSTACETLYEFGEFARPHRVPDLVIWVVGASSRTSDGSGRLGGPGHASGRRALKSDGHGTCWSPTGSPPASSRPGSSWIARHSLQHLEAGTGYGLPASPWAASGPTDSQELVPRRGAGCPTLARRAVLGGICPSGPRCRQHALRRRRDRQPPTRRGPDLASVWPRNRTPPSQDAGLMQDQCQGRV